MKQWMISITLLVVIVISFKIGEEKLLAYNSNDHVNENLSEYCCCIDISSSIKSSPDTTNEVSNVKKEAQVKEALQEQKIDEEKTSYSQEDLELLAHAINAEQGIEYEDEDLTNKLQIYAGQVILNRRDRHYRGASTIEDVLYSPGQYACVSDCSWDNPISERAYRNAELLLSGTDYWNIYGIPKMPDNVIFQAEFKQGSGVWGEKIMDTYFCYE